MAGPNAVIRDVLLSQSVPVTQVAPPAGVAPNNFPAAPAAANGIAVAAGAMGAAWTGIEQHFRVFTPHEDVVNANPSVAPVVGPKPSFASRSLAKLLVHHLHPPSPVHFADDTTVNADTTLKYPVFQV